MLVRLDHGRTETAGLLHLSVIVQAQSGSLNGLNIRYGDGQRHDEAPIAVACPAPSPSSTPGPAPASRTQRELVVSYRVAGTYTVEVDAYTDAHCASGPKEHLHAVLRVLITSGPALANGRQAPGAASVSTSDGSGSTTLEAFSTGDPDGFITTYSWDFGDGSRAHVDRKDSAWCEDPGTRWPASSDSRDNHSKAVHRYPRGGSYTVRVTITSAGCTGQDVQRVVSSTVVRV